MSIGRRIEIGVGFMTWTIPVSSSPGPTGSFSGPGPKQQPPNFVYFHPRTGNNLQNQHLCTVGGLYYSIYKLDQQARMSGAALEN